MNTSKGKKQDLYLQDVESIEDIDSFQYPLQTINTDWYHQALSNTFAFSLLRDKQYLCFTTYFPESAYCHPNDDTGSFIEGLWKYDVAELFVSISNSAYLEVNLSPHAAYWAAHFNSYRTQSDWKPDIPAICTSREAPDGMMLSSVRIPHRWYSADNSNTPLSLNVCAIRHGDRQKQTFISATLPIDVEPDFHLQELRQTVAIVS